MKSPFNPSSISSNVGRLCAAVLTCVLLSGCVSQRISITTLSDAERLPQPAFKALGQKKERPRYSEVKVYHVTDDCSVPECPLVWKIIVEETQSPRKIVYGNLPTFGSQTIVSPKDLQKNNTYHLHLGPAKGEAPEGVGKLIFVVDEEGFVRTLTP